MDQESITVAAGIIVTSCVKGFIEWQDRKKNAKHLSAKIDENTKVSVNAFNEANGVNAKIADAKTANNDALSDLSKAVADLTKAVASIQATSDETRRMVQLRLGDLKAAAL